MENSIYFNVMFLIQSIGIMCSAARTVFLEGNCGNTITLSQEPKGVLKLSLTPGDVYAPYMDCHLTVTTNQNMQIGVTFMNLDIMGFRTCHNDYLQIYDGVDIDNTTFLFANVHNHQQLCGKHLPPHFASRHSNVTFRFVSDSIFSSKGFLLLLTAFHTGSCQDNEFKCSNSRCIDEDLYCDNYNNCGDGSDTCQFSIYIIIGVAVSSFILLLALTVLCSVLRYRFRKSFTTENELDFDTVSIGTECTDFEESVPSGISTIAAASWFPDFNTNIVSVITRSNIDSNTSQYPGGQSTVRGSGSRSSWLNNQLLF